ncbi:hypothetical protein B0H67DRAFT_659126 [Lasiosphaeris hirsuta]|uniref:NmrA-like domain-containing protein n=1 Tax=Lasiosphaeris hirsuta TaxID=260670 RepID=A0AA40E685_9PEZI|nr:hypothetical protein B0H67DRAFT_659126 [Lasiosphaeris hirsuta]
MVRVAIAGGSGEVAQEVIDALVASKEHEIVILSRNGQGSSNSNPHNLEWRQVNYGDVNSLAQALGGIHTVLSFVQLLQDPGNKAQKNLIDASILASVARFAPSEWGSRAAGSVMPWWTGKDEVKEYLRQVNATEKVLEYTLFQPGLFLNYLATPHKTSKHLAPLNTFVDFHNRRAIVVDGIDTIMTFTTVQDMAAVVAKAVGFEGQWPAVGGIRGNRVAVSQLIEIGTRVRGGPFSVDTVKLEDLEAGSLTTSWKLEAQHHSVSGDEAEKLLRSVLVGTLLSSAKGYWDVSDEWNQLLPGHQFADIEEFLEMAWVGKP